MRCGVFMQLESRQAIAYSECRCRLDNFHFMWKHERGGSIIETDQVHMALKIVHFSDYLGSIFEACASLLIAYRFQKTARSFGGVGMHGPGIHLGRSFRAELQAS